jgi:hypothetical protein
MSRAGSTGGNDHESRVRDLPQIWLRRRQLAGFDWYPFGLGVAVVLSECERTLGTCLSEASAPVLAVS